VLPARCFRVPVDLLAPMLSWCHPRQWVVRPRPRIWGRDGSRDCLSNSGGTTPQLAARRM